MKAVDKAVGLRAAVWRAISPVSTPGPSTRPPTPAPGVTVAARVFEEEAWTWAWQIRS